MRQGLKRAISSKYFPANETTSVITLDPAVEQEIMSSVKQTEQGSYLSLDPDRIKAIIKSVETEIGKLESLGKSAIIITSPIVRMYFKKMTEDYFKDLIVLSYNEVAKIASKFKVNYNKNIAFITADTYRIAATDQLRTFANILDTPLSVIYTATELNSAVAEYEQADVIFVDTAGFSHKNETQRNDMRALLAGLSPEYEKSVYLVLSATTKYRDLISIIDSYKDIDDYKLIFTKLDETSSYGNLLNIKLYSDAGISYVTNGQNVPDDIEVFDTQKIVKQLLGGRQ